MACSFAPHNLTEIMDAIIYTLRNNNCKVEDLLQFVQGPDFPTGGTVINKDELKTAYLTGKGRARMRADYVIEHEKTHDLIVFTTIPYKVSKDTLCEDIDKLCEEGKLNGIVAIRDESTKDGVRFVIELDKGIRAQSIISKLYKLSRLEETYSFNQVALVDKKPKLLNLKQLIEIYINHQKDVLLRKTKYEYDKAQARIHILDGILKALEDIDNVIALIKKSESAAAARQALMAQYNLDEDQAKAILDIKLSRLARLEKVEIQEERDNLIKEIERLTLILKDPTDELEKVFINIKNTYGDARITKIIQAPVEKEDKEIEYVEPEKCVVVMTEGGTIKRIPTASYRTQKKNGKGIKSQEDITSCVLRTNTIDSLMIFSNKGVMYRLLVDNIPVGTNSSPGQSIKSLVNMAPDENPETMYSIYRDTDAKYVLFTTKNGLVKKTALEEYISTKKKTGIVAISLREGDSLASVCLIKDEPIVLTTKNGMGIKFNSTDITATSRATNGVKGINLNDSDEVISTMPIRHDTDSVAVFSGNGLGKKFSLNELTLQKRGGKGISVYKTSASTGPLTATALVADEDNLLITGDKASICVSAKDIPALGRIPIGNQIIKSSKIKSVTKV